MNQVETSSRPAGPALSGGPSYVNALPPSALPAKALGVTCAFFGMLMIIGAIASLCSGRLNIHIPPELYRGIAFFTGGVAVFCLGAMLLRKPSS